MVLEYTSEWIRGVFFGVNLQPVRVRSGISDGLSGALWGGLGFLKSSLCFDKIGSICWTGLNSWYLKLVLFCLDDICI